MWPVKAAAAAAAVALLWTCGLGDPWGGKVGRWDLLLNSTGVVAMHMLLTHLDTVVIFDQTGAGSSGLRCEGPSPACWVHSVEYDVASNTIRPLHLTTDTWCSSGALLSDGTLLQTGGYGGGTRRIRYFKPCADKNCDWDEVTAPRLAEPRWYASTQILPEKDRVIVVGGRNSFSYEFVPKSHPAEGASLLPFLRQTYYRRREENNLYPFLHVSTDGSLFIFANQDSVLFDYRRGQVVRTFRRMPGPWPRNYPSSGSSVLLPLDAADGYQKAEVLICGGAQLGAYQAAHDQRRFWQGLSSCGRLVITDENPTWEMEEMPSSRLMNDMIILPTGSILIINGAMQGSAGWELGESPALRPYLYDLQAVKGLRFSALMSTEVARMYHSSAILLADGRVLVAGSNPHENYTFGNVAYPTELRLQTFTPYYMSPYFDGKRAAEVAVESTEVGYGAEFRVRFRLERRPARTVDFHLYAPPFTTHSFSMNQRLLKLKCERLERGEGGIMVATVVAPPSSIVAPSGYYLLSVVNGGIPSKGLWMRVVDA